MVSIRTMLLQLEGLLGTKDLTDWEQDFVANNCEVKDTTQLSEKQVAVVERLWKKHFAG